jgi:hypothetical protein
VLCLLGLVAFAGPARAASPEPGDATYHSLRYNDDFTYLADPARSSDPWDPLKYIPLGDGPYGPSYLSFGGELRERFESYLNPNFGIHAPKADAYLLHRLLLNTDLQVTNYVRAFVQLGNLERLGDRGVTSSTDIDHFDLMQGFIDLHPPSPLGDAPVIRIGREELLFGYQRLIAVREGPNVRRDFDGFRLHDTIDDVSIDLLAVRPVADAEDVFDDHANPNQSLWGGYLTLPVGPVLKSDVYWLNYQNDAAKFRGLTGSEQRHTFGARLFGEVDGFDWNGEVALQTGRFRGRDIRADMLAGIAGYTFTGTPLLPRIGIETNFASGDNSHSSSIGTFNAMFPRLPYFAETSTTCVRCSASGRRPRSLQPLAGTCCGAHPPRTGCTAAASCNMPAPTKPQARGSAPNCPPTSAGGSISICCSAPSPRSSCPVRPCRRHSARR